MATVTHPEYVIVIAFALQHVIDECDSVLCLYINCLSFYSLQIQICCFTVNCTINVEICSVRNGFVLFR